MSEQLSIFWITPFIKFEIPTLAPGEVSLLNQMQKMTQRNGAVDALRGIAASMVMVLHIAYFFADLPSAVGKGDAMVHFFQQIDIGRMGITIFLLSVDS